MFSPRYQHVGTIQRRRIYNPRNIRMRLHRLERPERWEIALQTAVAAALPFGRLQEYPNYPPFYERLAKFLSVNESEIVIGAGIEEFIKALFMLCIEPGDRVAYTHPTCAMFDIYSDVFKANPIRLQTDPNKPLKAKDIIDRLPQGLRLFILPNPGQPVETYYDYKDLSKIAETCRALDAVFAIDEAYFGFGAATALGLHREFENVVILRTFSKAYGSAGIRLGAAIAGPQIQKALDAVRQSGEVSSFSMVVASVIMEEYVSIVRPAIAQIVEGRNLVRESIKGLGLKAWGNYANHVLIEFEKERHMKNVLHKLSMKGIYVKDSFPPPLERHMLVTCGSKKLMSDFVSEFKESL